MKSRALINKLLLGMLAFLIVTVAHSTLPLWTFTPNEGFPPKVSVNPIGDATVKYTVTNQSTKTHTLIMRPINGINQVTTPGNCPNQFTLGYKQSCTLNLQVNGSALPDNVVGGPVVCDQGNVLQCYQPDLPNSLNITLLGLTSISVTPTNPSIAKGTTQQFTATGTNSDGSTQNITTKVTWTSSNTAVATISNTSGSHGLVTSKSQGLTTITATSGVVSGNSLLTVTTATLVSIAVTPTNPSIANGTSQQFAATGTYSDSSTQNITTMVTWTSTNTAVATISNAAGSNGLATSESQGSATITANLGAASGNTLLTIFAVPCNQSTENVHPLPIDGNTLTIDSQDWIADCPIGYNMICKLADGKTDAYCFNSPANKTGNFSNLSSMGLTLLDLNNGLPFPGNIIPANRIPPSCTPIPPITSYSFPSNQFSVCAACLSISPEVC